MSARFFKIFVVVLLAHVLLWSLVWVGFSAPYPRLPASFTYEGYLPQEDTDSTPQESGPQDKAANQFVFDHLGVFYFNHWIALRDPSKPKGFNGHVLGQR